jgi:hypothetical protein
VSGTKPANQTGIGAQVRLGGGLQTGTEAQVLLSAAHSRRSKRYKRFCPADVEAHGSKGVPPGDAAIVLAFAAAAAAMAAISVLPGDKGIALAFAAAVAATAIVGGGDRNLDIVALLGENRV